MARTVFYVINQGTEWRVAREGSPRDMSRHDLKSDAVAAATAHALEDQPSRVKILRDDGTWDEATYGEEG